MKFIAFSIGFLFLFGDCSAQDDHLADSLKQLLAISQTDTMRGLLIHKLVDEYLYKQPDTCLYYAYAGLDLMKNQGTRNAFENARDPLLKSFEMEMYANAGLALGQQRNDSLALRLGLKALKMAEASGNKFEVAKMYSFLAEIYETIEEPAIALNYARMKYAIDTSHYSQTVDTVNMAILLKNLGEYDSALFYLKNVDPNFKLLGSKSWSAPHSALGEIYEKKGDYQRALAEYRIAIDFALRSNLEEDLPDSYLGLAQVFEDLANTDSSLCYAKYSLDFANRLSLPANSLAAAIFLSSLYESKGLTDSAFKFQKMAIAMKDKLFNKERIKLVQNYIFNEKIRQIEFKEEQSAYQTKIKIYALLAGLVILLLISGILVRNNQQKQKLNSMLQSQKSKIENTLADLKSTQAQLIQTGKMASLGEMTAGIAHEIQNPLNFVTNFSDLNKELFDELEQAIDRKNFDEVKSITAGIKENEAKINHHGLRADSIVKSMLLHARTSTGQKEETDINTLADEYFRLAYNAMRARNKSFACEFESQPDNSLKKINIVPQEIGRVLMNLYNNALYSVGEKKNKLGASYEPAILVITKKSNAGFKENLMEIHVRDNGNGIPLNVLDKIFQPFFTTKPTGHGSGLGLSISHDIIRAHGGEIDVKSIEGEYAEFIVILPINPTA